MTDREAVPKVILIDGQPIASDGKAAVVYRCRSGWEDLEETESYAVKFCIRCKRNVYQVEDASGVKAAIAAGQCVRVRERFFLGAPAYGYVVGPRLLWED